MKNINVLNVRELHNSDINRSVSENLSNSLIVCPYPRKFIACILDGLHNIPIGVFPSAMDYTFWKLSLRPSDLFIDGIQYSFDKVVCLSFCTLDYANQLS